VVRTPLLGIAYRSREPGTAPLVSVGAQVNRNDVLCLVEAMKLFNEITAPISGVITAIHFEDGALVEHGAALVSITPLADSPAAQPPTALATSSAAQSPAASPASAAAQSPTPSATLPAAQSPAASPNPSTTSAG
jgi:acetyl-CoA carboxylase biotin carboxyl carrier protein